MHDRDREIQVRVPSYVDLRNRNIVMQKHDYSCGAATLATILRYYWGDNVTEEDVLHPLIAMLTPEETKDRYKHGLAISDLRRVAVKMGYLSSIGTMSFEKLAGAKVPLIIPLKLGKHEHFVVYRGMAGGRVYLADPIRGNVRPTIAEFCGQWQKNAILVVAKKGMGPRDHSPLAITPCEVFKGETNDQMLRQILPGDALRGRDPEAIEARIWGHVALFYRQIPQPSQSAPIGRADNRNQPARGV